MSSPATDLFLELWRNPVTRCPRTLAKIEISTPSAVTFRVASAETVLPDGTVWEQGLSADPLRMRMERLGTGPNPCDTAIHLANRIYPFMSSGVLADALSDYQFQGARVTLYLWNDVRGADGLQLLDTVDLFKVYDRGVIDSFTYDDTNVHFTLLQSRSWNKRAPQRRIDKTSYPNATDGQSGAAEPILIGDFTALTMRPPHTSAYGNKQAQEDSGGGRGVVPLVVVDPGVGAASLKLLAAGHECKDLLDRAAGCTAFIVANDVLAPLDVPGTGLTETLSSTGSYLLIDDDKLIAYYGVRPVDVRTGAGNNTASEPRRAMDVFDETSFATLDQGAGKLALELMLPNVGSLGTIEAVDVRVCFSGNAANANTIRAYPRNPVGAVSGTALTAVSTVTTPTMLTGTWGAVPTWYSLNWEFGSVTGGNNPTDIKIDFSGGTTNKARIYWVALRVKFRPQRNLVTPQVSHSESRFLGGPKTDPRNPRNYTWFQVVDVPASWDPGGEFFGNLKGAPDTAGTYTGTAGALIERPPDAVRWFLDNYGETSTFETAAGAFGSFTDARALLRNGSPYDFKIAARIGDVTTVQHVIQKLCEQALCAVTIDPFSGKWLFHVWKQGAAVDYDHIFTRDDVNDLFEPLQTSDVELVQGVRVQYAYDHFLGRTLFESYVTEDSSSQGYSQGVTRDQRLVVDSTNDKLDWKTGAWGGGPTTYADTLAHATYTDPMDLAADLQAILRSRISTAAYYTAAGYGHHVVAGFNDALEFWYGASFFQATLQEGPWTPDDFAAMVQETMRSAAGVSTISVAYEHDVNKLRFTSSGSVLGFVSKFSPSCLSPASSAIWTLGFNLGTGSGAGSTNLLASYSTYAERFWMNSEPTATFQVLGLTGANMAAGCCGLLGFDAADDTLGNYHFARLSRGVRENAIAASVLAHGPHEDLVITADWVRDELAAQQLRDRRVDFSGRPPKALTFRTHSAPDIQRMRVIGFDASVNERRPYGEYGSDGSWAAKSFRVHEVELDLGPSYHQEIYAERA